jgi:hypothetical protein
MTHFTDLIKAFDDAIIAVHGENLARCWPHQLDKVFAKRWYEAGATVEMVTPIFMAVIERMKERGKGIPKSIHYFDNPVRDAIAAAKAKPEVELTPEESRWKARVDGWKRNPAWWQVEMWGSRPNEPGCRVPRRIMKLAGVETPCG